MTRNKKELEWKERRDKKWWKNGGSRETLIAQEEDLEVEKEARSKRRK